VRGRRKFAFPSAAEAHRWNRDHQNMPVCASGWSRIVSRIVSGATDSPALWRVRVDGVVARCESRSPRIIDVRGNVLNQGGCASRSGSAQLFGSSGRPSPLLSQPLRCIRSRDNVGEAFPSVAVAGPTEPETADVRCDRPTASANLQLNTMVGLDRINQWFVTVVSVPVTSATVLP
jgi:hypothetical protein